MTTTTSVPGLESELLEEIRAVAASSSCELLHAEFKGGTLRLVLDRSDQGVSIDDCATVSREVSNLLDAWDFGRHRYTLEVSSPGLDRQMYRPEDYERFAGRLMKVRFHAPEAERRRTVVARLARYEGDRVQLEVEETGERLELPLECIESARLEIEI